MARVKRAVGSKKHRKAGPRAGQGLLREQEPFVPRGQRAGDAVGAVRLPRPPGPQGRVPPAVDPAHQRRLPAERHQLQPVHRRAARGRHRGRPQGAGRPGRHRSRRLQRARRGRPGRPRRPRPERTGLHQPEGPATAAPPGAPQCAPGGGRVRRRGRGPAPRSPSQAGSRARGDLRAGRRAAARRRARRCARARRWRPASSSGSRPPRRPSRCSPSSATAPRRAEVLADAGFVVVAVGLSDPGNLGTILRTAEAAGADAVVLTPDTVDADQPEGRAGVGRRAVPACRSSTTSSWGSCGRPASGCSAPSAASGTAYTDADLTGRLALAVGNEAHGLPADAPVDGWLTIPHAGRAESLNAAMAAAVVCFEVARQRRVQAADRG